MRARRIPSEVVLAAGLVVGAALVAGCSSDDSDASDTTAPAAPQSQTVVVPPERLSPFCQAIADLDRQIAEAGPDDDVGAMIVDTYSSIVDDVPAEIRDDFLSVLAGLQEGSPDGATTTPSTPSTPPPSFAGSTTTVALEDVLAPDDSATLRLNSYVQFTCRASQNNPGPPDTQPDEPPPGTTQAP